MEQPITTQEQAELDCATRQLMDAEGLSRYEAASQALHRMGFQRWMPPPCMHTPRHARGKTLVFDLDGTLIQNGLRIDWENPQTFASHCRPYLDAWRRVRKCKTQGHRIVFLSARGEHLRAVTNQQVLNWAGVDVFQASEIILRRAKDFDPSWGAYISEKADKLCDLKADMYVGDRDEDQTAAAMAGVCFLRAEAWRAGIPWEPVLAAPPASALRLAAASSVGRARDLGVLGHLQALSAATFANCESKGTFPVSESIEAPAIGLEKEPSPSTVVQGGQP